MKIQRKVTIVFIIALLISIIAGVAIFISIIQTRESISKLALISEIRTSIFKRANLLDEYLLYRTDRASKQWILTADHVDELLEVANKTFNTPDQYAIFVLIKEHNNAIKQTGSQLFSNYIAQQNRVRSSEIEARLVGTLLIERSEMASYASILGDIVSKEISIAQQMLISSICLVVALLLLIIFMNLTWLRAILKKFEEISIKNQALLESIGDGVIAIDLEGKIILMNQSAQEMLGWHQEQMTGKLFYDVIAIEDDDGNAIPLQKRPVYLALAGTTTTSSTYNYVRKDKTKFPVAIKVTPVVIGNKIVGAIQVFRDITKEKALVKDLKKFRLAVDNVSDQIVITDPDATVLYINNACEKLTGYTIKETVGLKAGKLWGNLMEIDTAI